MIKALRKRHLQVWILWAVLLPVGIIVAWMAVPKKVTQELLEGSQEKSGLIVIDKHELKEYAYKILADTVYQSSKMYIEFVNKKQHTLPSLLIYQLTNSVDPKLDNQLLLGRIGSQGSHFFTLDAFTSDWGYRSVNGYKAKFVLYDFVNKKVIDTIRVTTPPFGEIDYSNF